MSKPKGLQMPPPSLLIAGALHLAASFLAFVVFRDLPALFAVSAVLTLGLLALVSRDPRLIYVFAALVLVGALSQIPFHPVSERLPIFLADILAFAATLFYRNRTAKILS
jgi:hypothetical protein